ncbi:MAG: radical SAM family heme chaperone HemW [Ruminococcaceae bacterium]|nr:radical SAM family heme chaperone HemW [Oscillospiraceae bacterium]
MMKKSKPLGLYLHVPFCRRKCLYCDFCSFADRDAATMDAYVACLCKELTGRAPQAAEHIVDTVYFGGGTPTLLSPTHFTRLLDTVRAHYRLSDDVEITVECNPATADEDKLGVLHDMGVNRLSIGAQSARDAELAALGRIHTWEQTKETYQAARRAGFDNVSLDVMFGIPHQTLDSFSHTLDEILALSPEHISAYSLIVEPDTPFFEAGDDLILPDEDTVCEMTDLLLSRLGSAGYTRYEISNFAREGRASRHNLHYWNMDDYLGFGPAAHSLMDKIRTGHSRDLAAYLAGEDITEPEETLDADTARDEYVMLRLRLADGVNKADFFARFGQEFDAVYGEVASPFVAAGLLIDSPERIAFTDRGFAVSNAVLAEMLFLG